MALVDCIECGRSGRKGRVRNGAGQCNTCRIRPYKKPVYWLAHEELDMALRCLMDEFNTGISGPSGLRAEAIAHIRKAILHLRSRKALKS